MEAVLIKLSENYKFFLEIATNIARSKDRGQDLLQSCLSYVADRYNSDTFHQALSGGYLTFLFIRALKQEYSSYSSNFHREFSRHFDKSAELFENCEETEEDIYVDQFIHNDYIQTHMNIIKDIIYKAEENKEIEEWERIVFEEYNFRSVPTSFVKFSKECKIPQASLWIANKKVMDNIKNKLKKRNYGNL